MQAALRGKRIVKLGVAMTSEPKNPVLLVDSREAARTLSVSPRKLWAMTFEGAPRLPHIKMGRLVRYSVADLESWIESQRKGGDQ